MVMVKQGTEAVQLEKGCLQLRRSPAVPDPPWGHVLFASFGHKHFKNYLHLSMNDRPRPKGRTTDGHAGLGKGRREVEARPLQFHELAG